MDKLGNYISTLMTIVIDKEQEQFVQKLALSELEHLSVNMEEFIEKHKASDEEDLEKTVKVLLQEHQEDNKNVKDK